MKFWKNFKGQVFVSDDMAVNAIFKIWNSEKNVQYLSRVFTSEDRALKTISKIGWKIYSPAGKGLGCF